MLKLKSTMVILSWFFLLFLLSVVKTHILLNVFSLNISSLSKHVHLSV